MMGSQGVTNEELALLLSSPYESIGTAAEATGFIPRSMKKRKSKPWLLRILFFAR
ncbi:hypothetical protein O9H85_02465 [Paenibacillus filicis]|uniref:Uncharacterized protein n=1 Tax=Paenibacillus gyeongsangnamensis TaxID=3388067 RepID=A0ABT4Q3D1_9BACL|nr:hypothetical protein [Paenibacillus filicis]MCZ8511318.1 hypothetical protein [Paenibacillus filicis]